MKKKFFVFCLFIISLCNISYGYQVLSTKEFGKADARNQNIVIKCTTDTGKLSNQTCSLRRYVKCQGNGDKKKCNGWQPWRDLRNTSVNYTDWKTAASSCCKSKGLR
ncbi:MAG: hypothetical protein MJ156_02985 [Alphaproteobacteria bacterium]|nr:hypothetical protein [Alphaproteobacteria bacterium]